MQALDIINLQLAYRAVLLLFVRNHQEVLVTMVQARGIPEDVGLPATEEMLGQNTNILVVTLLHQARKAISAMLFSNMRTMSALLGINTTHPILQ